jgi:UDP-glucose 4-epimerase
MNTCFITGGAGFIAWHLTKKLLDLGYRVISIDKKQGRNLYFDNPNYIFICLDINSCDYDYIFDNYNIDIVFHLAANSDIKLSQPDIELNDTFLTTYRLLETCRKKRINKFVFASSSAINGIFRDGNIIEKINMPISFYGSAKLASEAFISAYSYYYDLMAYILRFPNVVGGYATHGILFDLIKQIKNNPNELIVLGNGSQNKPYMHVSDLVDALLYILDNSYYQLNIYNISTEGRCTVGEIARKIINKYNRLFFKNIEITYTSSEPYGWKGDCPGYYLDYKPLGDLGWKGAKYNCEAAIDKAIEEIWQEY